MSNRFTWFTTNHGRNVIRILATTASCGAFGVTYFPGALFLEQYHNFMTLRKFNEPVPVPVKVKKLWSEVLDDLELNHLQKMIVKPFTIFGFDVWHAGSLKTSHGSIIGLPINFGYTDVAAIDKNSILLKNEPINWNREDAQQLMNSLILSDDAKKYAMAREVLMTNNLGTIIEAISSAVILGSSYVFTAQVNDSASMFQKPRAVRILMYALCGAFFWGVWVMHKDALRRSYETEADEHLSQLGVNYIKGAIEFYEKILQRHIAFRTLIGTLAEWEFKSNGNENSFIRMRTLPFTERKEFFEEKLKVLQASM